MTSGQSQRSVIVVHPDFDETWPWAADHFRTLWEAQGQTEFLRLTPDDQRAVSEVVAADVWDVEPLPLDDPLVGRHNVVHTPHNAGRTREANLAWTENLAVQFDPPEG